MRVKAVSIVTTPSFVSYIAIAGTRLYHLVKLYVSGDKKSYHMALTHIYRPCLYIVRNFETQFLVLGC